MRLKSIQLIICLLLGACGLRGEKLVEKVALSVTEAGTPLLGRWATSEFPLAIKVSELFTNEEYSAMVSSGEKWEAATSGTLNFFNFQGNTASNKGSNNYQEYLTDSEFGIYKRESSWFEQHSDSTLAITRFRGIIGDDQFLRITHADIIFNYQNYNFGIVDGSTQGAVYDIASVTIHELGHFIGVNHLDANATEAVMASSLFSRMQRRDLKEKDEIAINDIYDLSTEGLEIIISSHSGGDDDEDNNLYDSSMDNESKVIYVETDKDGYVSGTAELKADGECVHRINGKVIQTHKVNKSSILKK